MLLQLLFPEGAIIPLPADCCIAAMPAMQGFMPIAPMQGFIPIIIGMPIIGIIGIPIIGIIGIIGIPPMPIGIFVFPVPPCILQARP